MVESVWVIGLEFLISFVVSVISVPVFMRVAKTLGIVDKPDGVLKTHVRETPYLGGLGIFLGLVPVLWRRTDVLLMASFATSLGLLDDLFDLNPKIRLVLELSLSTYIVYVFVGFENAPYSLILMIAFTALINAVNMMDGLDGVCAGSVAISSLVFFFSSQNDFTASISLALVGSTLGYLIYNFPPAKVFMGDSGSYLLGTILAILYASSVRGPNPSVNTLKYAFPIWIYALDLMAGFIRRISNGRSPFSGDRDHFYDKINRKVKDPRKTLVYVYAIVSSFSVLTFLCRGWMCIVSLTLAILMSYQLTKVLRLLDYD